MPDRAKLLWLGDHVASPLAKVVSRFGLRAYVTREHELTSAAPEACVLVIPFYTFPQFVAAVRRTRITAWNHGLLIIACCEEPSLTSQLALAYSRTSLEKDSVLPGRPSKVLFDNWIELCVAAIKHDPGLPFLPIKIEAYDQNEESYNLPERDRFLISRAFSGFERVRARDLQEGHSGATAYIIHAFKTLDGYQRPIPFLAKISSTEKIQEERILYDIHVRDHIPFNNRPNVIDGRCCVGPNDGILVEDFLDRAERLDRVIRTSSPTVLIAAIFDGALRGWRLTPIRKTSSLSEFFAATGVVRDNKSFRAACANAKEVEGLNVSGGEIITAYEKLPKLEADWVTTHGDLHARNVFISAGSSEALIIDYASVGDGPAVADPACLEIDLVFFGPNQNLSHEFRDELYSYPLRIPNLRHREGARAWLWDAVRALRVFGGAASGHGEAYATALITYLLRIARLEAVNLIVRARAAALAHRLLCQISKS